MGDPPKKIFHLYMQSLVPRVVAIIEFGTEGDNCEVAKYKTTRNGGQAKCIVYFGGNFPFAFLFGCGFSLLWVLLLYLLIGKLRVPWQSDSNPIHQKLGYPPKQIG